LVLLAEEALLGDAERCGLAGKAARNPHGGCAGNTLRYHLLFVLQELEWLRLRGQTERSTRKSEQLGATKWLPSAF
jgi:hypothetical protein